MLTRGGGHFETCLAARALREADVRDIRGDERAGEPGQGEGQDTEPLLHGGPLESLSTCLRVAQVRNSKILDSSVFYFYGGRAIHF
jgi:hypothetical protein